MSTIVHSKAPSSGADKPKAASTAASAIRHASQLSPVPKARPSGAASVRSVATTGSQRVSEVTEAVGESIRLRHWTMNQLGENRKYRSLESAAFAQRFRAPPLSATRIGETEASAAGGGLQAAAQTGARRLGQTQARLDVIMQHYLWPYNARLQLSLGEGISEVEAELLGGAECTALARGHGHPNLEVDPMDLTQLPTPSTHTGIGTPSQAQATPSSGWSGRLGDDASIRSPARQGNPTAIDVMEAATVVTDDRPPSPPQLPSYAGPVPGVAPVTSYGGTINGAIAIVHERFWSSLHQVLHEPGPPVLDVLLPALSALLLDFCQSFPLEQLLGDHAGRRGRQTSARGGSASPRGDESRSPSPGGRRAWSPPGSTIAGRTARSAHSASPDRTGRSVSPGGHGTTARHVPPSLEQEDRAFGRLMQSEAVLEVTAGMFLYIFWTVLVPMARYRAYGDDTSQCRLCREAAVAQAVAEGITPRLPEARPLLAPDLKALAAYVSKRWSELEPRLAPMAGQREAHAATIRSFVLLAVRVVCEAHIQDEYTWVALLQAVCGAVDRQFPHDSSIVREADDTGILHYCCNANPLHKDIDRVCTDLLDPARLGSHLPMVESGEVARMLARRAKVELQGARARATRALTSTLVRTDSSRSMGSTGGIGAGGGGGAYLARTDSVRSIGFTGAGAGNLGSIGASAPGSSQQPQPQAGYASTTREWLVSTSMVAKCFLASPASPEARKFMRTGAARAPLADPPVASPQAMGTVYDRVRGLYASGAHDVPLVRERLKILGGAPPPPSSPFSKTGGTTWRSRSPGNLGFGLSATLGSGLRDVLSRTGSHSGGTLGLDLGSTYGSSSVPSLDTSRSAGQWRATGRKSPTKAKARTLPMMQSVARPGLPPNPPEYAVPRAGVYLSTDALDGMQETTSLVLLGIDPGMLEPPR